MSQIEVPKLVMYPLLGAQPDEAVVSKLLMYVLLRPGSDAGEDLSNKQGHVHTQIIKRS
jgi:hypothetical protein